MRSVVPKVGDFQHSYRLFFRLNRRLPHYRAKDGRLRLTVRIPLGIASGVDDDPLEQRYLSWIDCADQAGAPTTSQRRPR